MSKKDKSIHVNTLAKEYEVGIFIDHFISDNLQAFNEAVISHRHDYHIFLLAKKGNINIEIDFEQYKIKAPAVIYIHSAQVHRVVKIEKLDVYLLGMSNENLSPNYLNILEQVVLPAKSLSLTRNIFAIFNQTMILCATIFECKTNKIYASLLKDYCNAFVAYTVSQYLGQTYLTNNPSRFDIITKEFKRLLEREFIFIKRPSDYSNVLNISTPYLNECVKNATGFPVSYHIQQRVILEAKRLLYHSDKSVKEIANDLGYVDYAYFSRLFTKITGMTALAFRNRNFD